MCTMCSVSCVVCKKVFLLSTLSQRRRLEVAAARVTETKTKTKTETYGTKRKGNEGEYRGGREKEEKREDRGRVSEGKREGERKKKRKSVELIRVRDNAVAE